MTTSRPMWFLDLSKGWDVEFGCSELETSGEAYDSLAEAWENTSDVVRLWLCARFADTHESRVWCLGTAAACAAGLLRDRFPDDSASNPSVPALDVFDTVLEPLQRLDPMPNPRLSELADCLVHYYEVPRALLAASRINDKIAVATAKEAARIRRSGREPDEGEVEARMAAGVLAHRSQFVRLLVEAYRSAQAAMSTWRTSRGQPLSRWGTDLVRNRHRLAADGRAVEPVC